MSTDKTAHDAPPGPKTVSAWREHWQGEVDAAFLYRRLAGREPDAARRTLYEKLADVEDKHAERWESVFRARNLAYKRPRPSGKVRLQARVARVFGPRWLLPLLIHEEAGEVKSYLSLHEQSEAGIERSTAFRLAKDSVQHATILRELSGTGGEPWHRIASGDFLRNIVYGFNDGLTANFGLVAGIVGGALSHHVILLAGLAGAIADALSMGASGYLASQSQREVHEHEIDMERQEILLMPDLEREELALIYETKGMSREDAARAAAAVMADPERALREKTREELQIGEEGSSPLSDGIVTGAATAIGAIVPVAPFLVFEGRPAMALSFALSMGAHFAVGAARSLFTGRGVIRSGIDMFVVGFGVAAVSYFVGDVLVRWLVS